MSSRKKSQEKTHLIGSPAAVAITYLREQTDLFGRCCLAMDLLEKRPMLAATVCDSATLDKLRASLSQDDSNSVCPACDGIAWEGSPCKACQQPAAYVGAGAAGVVHGGREPDQKTTETRVDAGFCGGRQPTPVAAPSQYGSPELQAFVLAQAAEKDFVGRTNDQAQKLRAANKSLQSILTKALGVIEDNEPKSPDESGSLRELKDAIHAAIAPLQQSAPEFEGGPR